MNKLYPILLFFTLSTLTLSAQQMDSPEGMWQTLDDETGEVESVVEIYEQDGAYFGRISDILTDNKDAKCTKCSGKQKDQPVLGLVIIKDLEKDGDEWNGGTIMDPRNGSTYRLISWFEEDPNKLYIRGKHWTGLYRTQTWTRKK